MERLQGVVLNKLPEKHDDTMLNLFQRKYTKQNKKKHADKQITPKGDCSTPDSQPICIHLLL